MSEKTEPQREDVSEKEDLDTEVLEHREVKLSPLDRLCEKLSENSKDLVEKLQEEIEALRKLVQERDEYLKILQRVQADFINYQNRIKREKESWEKYKSAHIVTELLSAFDNLLRVIQVKCTTQEAENLRIGIELCYREIIRILEKNEIKVIKTVGQIFDPTFHEAVGNVESADVAPGTILEEVRSGFMLYERVLRPAQVIIASPLSQPSLSSNEENKT